MATVTYFGTGTRTVFPTPKSLSNKTATVAGVAATISAQDHLSVTFAAAPGFGKAVVITTADIDLETVDEAAGGASAFSTITGNYSDNAGLNAAITANANAIASNVTAIGNKADAASTTTALAAKQASFIAPRTEGATVALAATDNGGASVCPVACAVTVPAVGVLGAGFSRGFFGPGVVTFTGATDDRTSGAAKPACALVNWPDGTFHAVGGKA